MMNLPDRQLGTTQMEILRSLLHADAPLPVDTLTRRLQISRNATYQHIMALERDGLIQKAAVTETKGRPGQTFQLTDKGVNAFPKHYALFAQMLIKLVKSRMGSDELRECLRELGQSLAGEFRERLAGLKGDDIMIEVAGIMQELGYEAEAIAREDGKGLQIRAYNCVFHDLAKEHEEVCDLDIALISALTGKAVDQTECVVRGGFACRFCTKNLKSKRNP